MPELPEVETYVRELEPSLRECQITGATIYWERIIAAPAVPQFIQGVIGERFATFDRRGKYMLLGMASGKTLIVHLRMTGKLLVQPERLAPGKHTHVTLDLDNGGQLHYQDPRKFGRLWLVEAWEPLLQQLGPEPLSTAFTPALLAEQLRNRSASIKALLLNQTIVAGVGNIYADESLFMANIHPTRAGGELRAEEIERLYGAIRTVLAQAIQLRGSSLGKNDLQNYTRPTGEIGGFQEVHQVFQRTNKPCRRCGQPIERIVLAQRGTHFCPNCQPIVG